MNRIDPKTGERRTPGVPVTISDANREWWKGRSGEPARGLLVDAVGKPVARPIQSVLSFDFLAECIRAKDGPGTYARSVLDDIAISRNIRNRPRLKAMLGAA